jgi:hypothetical protein
MTFQEFKTRVQQAKDLDFGDIFNKSIALFKKVWVQGLIMLLLTMVMMIPIWFVMYLPMIGAGFIDLTASEIGSDWSVLLMIPFGILVFVFSLCAMIISFGMRAGFYRICKMKDLNQAGPDDYFYYLKKPYLGKVFKLSLASFGIVILATMLCVFPVIYVSVPIALMYVVFAMNPEMSVSDIIKSSFELGNKKWFITFALMIIAGLLSGIVGMLLCGIGVYITASFSYIPAYYIYKESVGFDDSDELKQIESF